MNTFDFVLAGNPNAGKSSLFNALTGKNRKVGNWHGVTVDGETAFFKADGREFSITDLPGLYTIKGGGDEERVAEEFLRAANYRAIIVVAEAKTFLRSVRLIRELRAYNVPVIVFINFYREFTRLGGKIDLRLFSQTEGVYAFAGDAINAPDVKKFKAFLSAVRSGNDFRVRKNTKDESVNYYVPQRGATGTLLLKPFIAYPAFIAVTLAVFYLAFGRYSPATMLANLITQAGETTSGYLKTALYGRVTPFISGLLTEGIITGFCSVSAFLPQIAVLSACLSALDLSGYLSHASALSDGILNKAGLSGRAIYTLASGYGCTALAAASSLSIGDENVKKRAILCLPLVSCSARTPVYVFIAKAAFKNYAFLVLAAVYALSAILPVLRAKIIYKFALKTPPKPLIAEIAPIRPPKLKILTKALQNTLKSFIIKLGTVIILLSVTVYILRSVSPRLEYLPRERAEESLLSYAGKFFAVFLRPIGITDWRYGVAIGSGIFAKESVAATLATLFPDGISLNVAQASGLIAFTYAYTPCLTALAAIKSKTGFLSAALTAVYQLLFAVVFSHLIYLLTLIFI